MSETEVSVLTRPHELKAQQAVSGVLAFVLLVGLGLTGCGNTDLSQTLNDIRSVPVDDGDQVSDKDKREAQSKVPTATHRRDQVLEDAGKRLSGLQIELAEASELMSDKQRAPLDVTHSVTSTESKGQLRQSNSLADSLVSSVSHLPDTTDSKIKSDAKQTENASGLMVQIGSFSSKAAAQSAFDRLMPQLATSGAMDKAKAHYETVEREGKTLVRLKLGPVATQSEAKALCRAAGQADNWCIKSAS